MNMTDKSVLTDILKHLCQQNKFYKKYRCVGADLSTRRNKGWVNLP